MVVYKSQPQFRVSTDYSGTTYTFTNDQFLSGRIIRVENGFDTATLFCNDYKSLNFLAKVDVGEDVKVEFRDASESTWETVFNGVCRFINTPFSVQGEILELKCDGAGYGFGDTVCGEEYGADSAHISLDTIKEIVEDATNGIVDKWVESILGTATASGHTYTTEVETIAGTINYVYFPYKPCNKTLNDLCDIVQGIKGASAGPHWIVTTGNKLILSTIGNHHAAAVTAGWDTYYGASQANATFVQGVDFIEYYFQKLEKEANYILYHGAYRKPADGDKWTESVVTADWGKTAAVTLAYDGDSKVGAVSLKGRASNPADILFWYPSGVNAAWQIDKWGGKYNIPTISFWVMRDANTTDTFQVRLYDTDGDYFYKAISLTADTWTHIIREIGPYAYLNDTEEVWSESLTPIWTEVDYVSFICSTAGADADLYVDGLQFNGQILRGAKAAGIGASDPLKIKVITDNVAKDDSGVASDDTGTIGRLAYAELLRAKSTPYIGTIKTPLIKDLWPGNLLHIHAKKKRDGTFNINKDMRVTRLIHEFSVNGYTTISQLTDDVTNSNARLSFTSLNKVLAAARPEFQDRQATSIKTREIDITQAILEHAAY